MGAWYDWVDPLRSGKPRIERLDLRATIENPINSGSKDRTGGAGCHDQPKGEILKLTYLSGTNHTPVDSISFCFGFYLTSTGKGGKSIWKGTGIGEGDLAREYCFLFLSFSMFFLFSFEIYFLIWIRILICTILVNDFWRAELFCP